MDYEFVLSQTILSLTSLFIEKCINISQINEVNYENISCNVYSNAHLISQISLFFSISLVN
jgi:hypothetical protein